MKRGLLLGAALALALAVGAWWVLSPREGHVVGLYALSDVEALLLVRWQEGDAGALIRARADGSRVWTSELSGRPDVFSPRHGIVLDGGRAYLRLIIEESEGLAAVDLASGEVVWEQALDTTNSQSMVPPLRLADLLLDARRVDGEMMYEAREAATGALRWRQPLGEDALSAQQISAHAVGIRGPFGVEVLHVGPSLTDLSSLGLAVCARDGLLYGIAGSALVIAEVDTPDASPRLEPLTGLEERPGAYTRSCGWRRDRLVFTGIADEQTWVRVVDPERLELVHDLPIDGLLTTHLLGDEVDDHPLAGDLGRVVPLLVYRDGHKELALVDVDQGTLVSMSRGAELSGYEVVRAPGGVHLLQGFGDTVALDAESGRLLAAVRSSARASRGIHGSGEVLWVYGSVGAHEGSWPVERYDPRTFQPLGARGPTSIASDSEAWAERLDLPGSPIVAPQ